MKKTTALIAVLMAVVLLLSACGKKTITEKDLEGKWSVTESTARGENNLSAFIQAANTFWGQGGGLIISGERICLASNLKYEMREGDICTFELKDGKIIIHDLDTEDVPDFGDFEADIKLEGKKLILTDANASLTLEKK
jgi:hypothetical protein